MRNVVRALARRRSIIRDNVRSRIHPLQSRFFWGGRFGPPLGGSGQRSKIAAVAFRHARETGFARSFGNRHLTPLPHGLKLRSCAESCASKPYCRPSSSLWFAIAALVGRVIVIACSLPTSNVNLVRYHYQGICEPSRCPIAIQGRPLRGLRYLTSPGSILPP
jgi:hypothetical protein